jgi:hypothetical protein
MTRIEERLRDALQASAARVRDDRLGPLPARDPDPGAERKARRRQVWRAWLIPVAAAASVVLVIGLILAVTRHATPAQQQPANQQTPLPGYFVRIAPGGGTPPIEVQSVSTGAVIATVRPPKPPRGGALNVGAVAAAPDDRTFYVEYGLVSPNINVTQTWILTFSITGSGSATPLTTVKGGLLSHQPPDLQTWGSLAVSPDGSKLALTVDSSDHISNTSPGYSDKIIVIDLHTGQRTQWQGGLYRPGRQFSIPDLSWAADGQSLVFLGQWCDPAGQGTTCDGTSGPGGYRDAQVRSLSTAAGGGSLNHGRLLLAESARYPLIAQALGGPHGSDLTVAVPSGQANKLGERPELTVEDVSAATGAVRGVDYRVSRAQGFGGDPQQVWLAADPSGQHLLVSYAVDGGFIIGWIGHGALHRLPITQPYLPNNPTLIIAW